MSIPELESTKQNELKILGHYLWQKGRNNILDTRIHGAHFLAYPQLREVWDQARDAARRGDKWDFHMLSEKYPHMPVDAWDEMCKPEYYCDRDPQWPEQSMLEAYAANEIVRKGHKVFEDIASGEMRAPEAVSELRKLADIGEGTAPVKCKSARDVDLSIYKSMFLKGTRVTQILPMPMDLADYYGGWRTGKTFYICARTSCYKTTFLSLSAQACAAEGTPVLFWTLEDDSEGLEHRMIVRNGIGITYSDLDREYDKGDSEGADMATRIVDACKITSGFPIHYREDPLFLETMAAEISRAVAETGARVLLLDFLQLVGSAKVMFEHDRNTEVVKLLASVAKRLNIAIIIAAQFTQDATRRMDDKDGRAPGLGDIRGGSAIGQAAYGVFMNHVPIDENGDPIGNDLTLLCRKFKRGKRRSFPCHVDGAKDTIWRTEQKPMAGTVIDFKPRVVRPLTAAETFGCTREPKDDD